MKEISGNSFLSSIRQAIYEPKQSKYFKKLINSVNKHIRSRPNSNQPENEDPLIEDHSKQSIYIFHSTKEDHSLENVNLSDNSTEDSGIITFKDETIRNSRKKTISFSPENDEVIEIEPDTEYYDMPQKCVAHISQTPELQKVDYKMVCNSIATKGSDVLTREVIEKANLIRNHYCDPELVLDLSAVENIFVPSANCKSIDEKFVVNLFESRSSKRWKRRGIYFPDIDATVQTISDKESQVTQKSEPENHNIDYPEPVIEHEALNDDEMFQKLKKERDIECVKMVQASNVLKMIRKNSHKDWSDELLAEKILLETDEKYTLLVNKIRDLGYAEVIRPKPSHKATITLSNFEFILRPQEARPNSKYSEFFIVTLSHETELLLSKATSPSNDKLIFDEKFTFANLNSDFNIVVKMFMIKLKTSGGAICSLLGKKTKNLCPMSQIYYENVNTYEMEASSVLKPSFNCIAQLVLTKDHIGSSQFTMSKISGDSRLLADVSYSFQLNSLKINSKLSDFLTLGLPSKHNDIILWERKWCVLHGMDFQIYNYPSEQDFGIPASAINLEYCLTPLATNYKNCPRKGVFLLKTGRPALVHDMNNAALKKKPNFVVEKYFFMADNRADFNVWTNELQSILNCLRDWHQLVFLDDYY